MIFGTYTILRIDTLNTLVEFLLNFIHIRLWIFNLAVVSHADVEHGKESDRNRICESNRRLFPILLVPDGLTFYKVILKVLHPSQQVSFGECGALCCVCIDPGADMAGLAACPNIENAEIQSE